MVTVEQYLSTEYDPDVEFVDGVLIEKSTGEYDHARLQLAIGAYLLNRESEWGIHVSTDPRTQVLPTRFRLPDVCVQSGSEPSGQILTEPPFLCIEILSKDDRADDVQEKIDEYLSFGVPWIWTVHHRKRLAYIHYAGGMQKAADGVLWTKNPELSVPLAEVWPKWTLTER